MMLIKFLKLVKSNKVNKIFKIDKVNNINKSFKIDKLNKSCAYETFIFFIFQYCSS